MNIFMSEPYSSTVLVVDDVQTNVFLLTKALRDQYHVITAMDGENALERAFQELPDLVLLDIMMPGMDGYEVCRRLKEEPKTRDIPVIFVTAKGEEVDETKGLELGAVDYLTKPLKMSIVRTRVYNHLQLKHAREELERQRDSLELKVQERTQQVTQMQEVTIQSMATLAEYRDPETGGHIQRTQHYIKRLAERLREKGLFQDYFDLERIEMLTKSAPLHDIGKVGVPDHILLKPGKLDPDEFEEIKKHPGYGRDALKFQVQRVGEASFLEQGMEIAYTHHEKWDGSGYPRGLEGEGIPLAGRLMALVDVYDALVSKRVYKEPFAQEKVIELMKEGRGSHFDPDLLDTFLELTEDFRQIILHYADFEEEREAAGL